MSALLCSCSHLKQHFSWVMLKKIFRASGNELNAICCGLCASHIGVLGLGNALFQIFGSIINDSHQSELILRLKILQDASTCLAGLLIRRSLYYIKNVMILPLKEGLLVETHISPKPDRFRVKVIFALLLYSKNKAQILPNEGPGWYH